MNHLHTFGDFRCVRCHNIVSSAHLLSGVNNRNHCPYCLWSRHLDLHSAGDRLSACKSPMQPVALTTKRNRNKYRSGHGEVMLVHQCAGCDSVSINRIAADDDAQTLLETFNASHALPTRMSNLLLCEGIEVIPPQALPQLQLQLFGSATRVHLAELV